MYKLMLLFCFCFMSTKGKENKDKKGIKQKGRKTMLFYAHIIPKMQKNPVFIGTKNTYD